MTRFSAEFHQVGQGRVEIATRPGVDRWRGNAGLNLRPSGLSARNAVARAAPRPGTLVRMNAFAAGPLVPESHLVLGRASKARRPKTPRHFGVHADGPVRRDDSRSRSTAAAISVAHRGPADAADAVPRVVRAQTRPSAGTRASPSSIFPSAATRREDVEHELRFSLEGGQRRPFHLRLQFDQSTQRGDSRHDRARPSSCRTPFARAARR